MDILFGLAKILNPTNLFSDTILQPLSLEMITTATEYTCGSVEVVKSHKELIFLIMVCDVFKAAAASVRLWISSALLESSGPNPGNI